MLCVVSMVTTIVVGVSFGTHDIMMWMVLKKKVLVIG